MNTIRTNFEGPTIFIGINVYKVWGFTITQEVLWVESSPRECQNSSAVLLFLMHKHKQIKHVSSIFHNFKPGLSLLTIPILILWNVYYVLR